MKGNLREFQGLLDRKSMIMARDQVGATPLHKAVLYGHYELAEYIATNFAATLDARDNVSAVLWPRVQTCALSQQTKALLWREPCVGTKINICFLFKFIYAMLWSVNAFNGFDGSDGFVGLIGRTDGFALRQCFRWRPTLLPYATQSRCFAFIAWLRKRFNQSLHYHWE